jgi:hypothetical protein
MRGDHRRRPGMFSYLSHEKRVSADHPLRPTRAPWMTPFVGCHGNS